MREFIHNDVKHVDDAWDEFKRTHRNNQEYKTEKEFSYRKSVFHQNYR